MKKIIFSVTILLIFNNLLFAQSGIEQRCGSTEYLEQQIKKDPSLAYRLQEMEKNLEQQIHSNSMKTSSGAVVTIPVVVHVVYNAGAENLTDTQVKSQIDVLNQDYRMLNPDLGNTPAAFKSLEGDAHIEFCLASMDPNGKATTGVVRKQTTVTSFNLSDNGVKYSVNGGDDAWDPTKYLNIWTCNLGGGILGYAQIPGLAAATDGVVIKYYAFGYAGSAKIRFDKGRTTTHEVGHWLGLIHVWGDANCGDDQVADTPTQQAYNVGCPLFPHPSCSNGASGDMFMNFMDYVDDACMSLFTIGQVARITGVIDGTRSALKTSTGCSTPTGIANDKSNNASVTVFPNPSNGLFSCTLEGISSPLEIKVTNMMGELIYEKMEGANGIFTLDLSQHASGIYMMRIADGNSVSLKKLMVGQ